MTRRVASHSLLSRDADDLEVNAEREGIRVNLNVQAERIEEQRKQSAQRAVEQRTPSFAFLGIGAQQPNAERVDDMLRKIAERQGGMWVKREQ